MEENLLSTRAAYTELSHSKRIPKKPVLCKATKIWGLILTRGTEKIFFFQNRTDKKGWGDAQLVKYLLSKQEF